MNQFILKLYFYLRREGIRGMIDRVRRKLTPDLEYMTWSKKNGISRRKRAWNIEEIHKLYRCIDIIFLENDTLQRTIGGLLNEQIYKPRGIYNDFNRGDGEYILLVQGDLEFEVDMLYEFYLNIRRNPTADIMYCDHDIDYKKPIFKPDFNYDLLLSYNYIGGIVMVKREIFDFVRSQEKISPNIYEIIFQLVELSDNIDHIPIVLYHSMGESFKENAIHKRIVSEHLGRIGYNVDVCDGIVDGTLRVLYKISPEPLVSIVIPNMDHVNDLKKCLNSIVQKQKYANYEIIIVENSSVEKETFLYYQYLLETFDNIRILYWENEFNYSAINNYAVKKAKGSYILLLNNDVEFISENALGEMVGICARRDVGAVGAKLYYPDGTIQHAGIIIGYGGIAGHAFLNFPENMSGYMGRINCAQNYSAVTAACMLVKKTIYEAVGGLDAAYKIAFNDVDFCLKVINIGARIVYTPYVEAYHYESKTRGPENSYTKMKRFNQEVDLFRSRWGNFIYNGDPAYNPNLTLYRWDFSLKI